MTSRRRRCPAGGPTSSTGGPSMSRLPHLPFLLLVVVAATPVRAAELPAAKPAEVGLDADKLQQAHDAVKALVEKKEGAGAGAAAARRGKVAMFEAFGESEAGSGRPMKPDAIVRIYSMTKPVT